MAKNLGLLPLVIVLQVVFPLPASSQSSQLFGPANTFGTMSNFPASSQNAALSPLRPQNPMESQSSQLFGPANTFGTMSNFPASSQDAAPIVMSHPRLQNPRESQSGQLLDPPTSTIGPMSNFNTSARFDPPTSTIGPMSNFNAGARRSTSISTITVCDFDDLTGSFPDVVDVCRPPVLGRR
jgi:hypothetical protein